MTSLAPADKTKAVHTAKVIVGDEKTMMVNLAEGATVIGGSADKEMSRNVFDGSLGGDRSNLLGMSGPKSTIIFNLKESGIVKHWRFFNDRARSPQNPAEDIQEIKLQVFDSEKYDIETLLKTPNQFDKDDYWITVDSYKSKSETVNNYDQVLKMNSAKYWRVTVDTKGGNYSWPSLPELQILGYPLPNADTIMKTVTIAKGLSQQKDKFSQKMLDELKIKEMALETSLNSKIFDVTAINANAGVLKDCIEKRQLLKK